MIEWLLPTSQRASEPVPIIELAENSVPIILKCNSRAKRMTLRLAPDGSEVRITIPHWARPSEAIAFAHSRREWLEGQIAKIPQSQPPAPDGSLLYRGESLQIEWEESAPRRAALRDTVIRVGGPKDSLPRRLQSWLEKEALALFEADMRDYCGLAGLEPVPVALSRAQKRWGSCSEKSRIRLNWRLVQAPDFVRRSVVAHEVAHLVHFDHSTAFHALLGDIYENDIRGADRWLKDNGRTLYAQFR